MYVSIYMQVLFPAKSKHMFFEELLYLHCGPLDYAPVAVDAGDCQNSATCQ